MDIERLKEDIRNVEYDLEYGEEQHQERIAVNVNCLRSAINFINEAIDSQSVTSKVATEAIDLLKEIQHDKYVIQNHTENDVKNYELVSFAIAVLKEYQPWVSVEDGLPDGDLTSVLIYTKEGGVAEGQYYPTIRAWKQFR